MAEPELDVGAHVGAGARAMPGWSAGALRTSWSLLVPPLFPVLRKTLAAGPSPSRSAALVAGWESILRIPRGQRGPRPRPGLVAIRCGRVPVGCPGPAASLSGAARCLVAAKATWRGRPWISLEKAAKAYAAPHDV